MTDDDNNDDYSILLRVADYRKLEVQGLCGDGGSKQIGGEV